MASTVTSYLSGAAQILLIIGGLNWLTVPILYSSTDNAFPAGPCQPYDLLSVLLGGLNVSLPDVAFFVYIVVGLASILQIGLFLYSLVEHRLACSIES